MKNTLKDYIILITADDLVQGSIIITTAINILLSKKTYGDKSYTLVFWNSEFNRVYTFNYEQICKFSILL